MIGPSLLFAGIFALVHVAIGWLTFLDRTPRSRWLSAAGGVAVAYVFLHVLPELAYHQTVFADELGLDPVGAERAVYALALLGLVSFYGLENAITSETRRDTARAEAGNRIFWLHIGSFTLYNVIIGYLLVHREESGLGSLLAYGVAMSLHFVTSDFGLWKDHRERYDRVARWVLAAAVLGGVLIGFAVEVAEVWIGFLFAFLAGGIVLNVLKEELPEERESRFWPFLGAAGVYAALLFAI